MASIWKDSRTKNWVACFTDRNGRRLKKSTGETDGKKAQKIADEYEKVARIKQTLRTVRTTITSLTQDIWGLEIVSPSVREHIETWLEEKRADTAESTMEFYEKSTKKFLDYLGPAADEPIDHIDRSHVSKFKIEVSKSLSAKTANHHLKLLRMVFRAAKRDGMISEDPAEFVDGIKKKERSARRAFTVDEVRQVLAVCDAEWRSIVLFGLYTGQRLADVVNLRWANVDLENREVRIVARKTNRPMKIPMAPALEKHVQALLSGDGTQTGRPVRERLAILANEPVHPQAAATLQKLKRVGSLSNQFSSILVRAGLRDASVLDKAGRGKGRQGKRVVNELSFHSLRHTAVSLLKEAGIPAAVVMEMIGHDSEQMSQHYTHVGKEAMEKAAGAFPDL